MRITGRTRLAGIMGWPVGHSRSPSLHNFWLDEHGIDGVYVPLAVRPEGLEQALRSLPVLGFRGCNLTIPHKEAAVAIADRVDPLARRVGAVNTIVVGTDGRLEASNSDISGFRENLRETVPDWRAGAAPAVVLGSGGAARAVVAALIEVGAREIRLVNRTTARAEQLARELAAKSCDIAVRRWSARHEALADAGILVNTTSLGMAGEAPLDLDLTALPRNAVVCDLVYVPLDTPLLSRAKARGNPTVDGLGMLLHQARPGFEAWFGTPVRATRELRAAVLTTFTGGR